MGLFSGKEEKNDPVQDLAILDFLFNDEKEIIEKDNYDLCDFDDETEDEDDYYEEEDE